MERQKTRKSGVWARIIGVIAGALFIAATMSGPASAENAPETAPQEIQIEAVKSDTPVMVEDVVEPQLAAQTYYCAVRDGTFGCQQGQPGDGLVVTILYQHPNYGGFRIVVFNPSYQYGCTTSTGNNEGGANLGPVLDNRISSVKTYNHCDVKLFSGNNLNGESSRWIHRDANIGALDQRTNSFRIS